MADPEKNASSHIVEEAAESVAFGNVKTIGEGPSFFQNQMFQLAVNAATGWTNINQAVVGKVAESIMTTQVSESMGDAVLAQQAIKAAQTTRPETGAG